MQDRQHQDLRYSDRGPRDFDWSRRGGRGGGGGYIGSGRGPPGPNKFDKIAQMRQQSRASIHRRQLTDLDLAEGLAPSSVSLRNTAIADAATSQRTPLTGAIDNYDHLPSLPTGLMHAAFQSADQNGAVSAQLDAGDLSVAVQTALANCSGNSSAQDHLIPSKFGGEFLCRPDQVQCVAQSSRRDKQRGSKKT